MLQLFFIVVVAFAAAAVVNHLQKTGWSKIDSITFNADGYGFTPNPATKVTIVSDWLLVDLGNLFSCIFFQLIFDDLRILGTDLHDDLYGLAVVSDSNGGASKRLVVANAPNRYWHVRFLSHRFLFQLLLSLYCSLYFSFADLRRPRTQLQSHNWWILSEFSRMCYCLEHAACQTMSPSLLTTPLLKALSQSLTNKVIIFWINHFTFFADFFVFVATRVLKINKANGKTNSVILTTTPAQLTQSKSWVAAGSLGLAPIDDDMHDSSFKLRVVSVDGIERFTADLSEAQHNGTNCAGTLNVWSHRLNCCHCHCSYYVHCLLLSLL